MANKCTFFCVISSENVIEKNGIYDKEMTSYSKYKKWLHNSISNSIGFKTVHYQNYALFGSLVTDVNLGSFFMREFVKKPSSLFKKVINLGCRKPSNKNDIPESDLYIFKKEVWFCNRYRKDGTYKKEIKKATFLKNADIKSYFSKSCDKKLKKKILQGATFYKICTGGNCYGYIMITRQFFPTDSVYENIVFFN